MPLRFLFCLASALVAVSIAGDDQRGLREQLSELQQEDETNEKLIETLLTKEHKAEAAAQSLRKEVAEARSAKKKGAADEAALRMQLRTVKSAQSTALAQANAVTAQLDEERNHIKQLESTSEIQAHKMRDIQMQLADERGRADGLEAAVSSKASELGQLRKAIDVARGRALAYAAGRASAQRAHEEQEVRRLQASLLEERDHRKRVESADSAQAAETHKLQESLAEERRHEQLLEKSSRAQVAKISRLNASLTKEASQRQDLARSNTAQAAELRKLKAALKKESGRSQLQESATASAGGVAQRSREERLEKTTVKQQAEIERLRNSLQRAKQALWRTLDDDGTSSDKDAQTAQSLKRQLQAAQATELAERQELRQARAKSDELKAEAKRDADSKHALENSLSLVRKDLLRAASDAAAAGAGSAPPAAADKPPVALVDGSGLTDRLAAAERNVRALRDENLRLKAGGHELMERYDLLLKSIKSQRQRASANPKAVAATKKPRMVAAKVDGARATQPVASRR